MRIASFSVRDYRSITRTEQFALSDYTVLIGPNNEGKSNILRALSSALQIASLGPQALTRDRKIFRYSYSRSDEELTYSWKRDYPLHLQASQQTGISEITIDFAFSDQESEEFKKLSGSQLSTNLKLKLALGRDSAKYEAVVRGRGKKFLSERIEKIAEFLQSHLKYQYIPSTRTSRYTEEIIADLVNTEIRELHRREEYRTLMSQLNDLQRPLFNKLSADITTTIKQFIPGISKIDISTGMLSQPMISQREILVDDGTKTDISLKGDGLKSLLAIAMVRHSLKSHASGRAILFAIEEPEAHLHPDAIHVLKRVLIELSEGMQVIVSTHSPILVDRSSPRNNLIVSKSKAAPASRFSDIRMSLGIRLADNLTNAELLLFVEGDSDRSAITGIINSISKNLKSAIVDGRLQIQSINGIRNVHGAVLHSAYTMCNCYLFLDSDSPSRQATKLAMGNGQLTEKQIYFAAHPGLKESELEDLYDLSQYSGIVLGEFGVNLNMKRFTNRKKKWTTCVKETFLAQGKPWDADVEGRLKALVSNLASDKGQVILHPDLRESIDSLVLNLEGALKNK